jgi:hypothetical protein
VSWLMAMFLGTNFFHVFSWKKCWNKPEMPAVSISENPKSVENTDDEN